MQKDNFWKLGSAASQIPLYKNLIQTGLFEQWIEYDLLGRVNPYRIGR